MATIITRETGATAKGSPLTNIELDNNFININKEISYAGPSIAPSLNLDFANSKTVDPRITFSRASTATFYDGKTTAKAEENLLKYSQEFDNLSVWNLQASAGNTATIVANSTAAPDGTLTADKVTFTGTTASDRIYQDISITSVNGVAVTGSIWIKADTPCTVNVTVERSGPVDTENFSASVTTTWTRFVINHSTTWSGTSALRLNINTISAPGYIYIWGAQLEQRSSVTAYTPTTTQPITNYIPALQTAAAGVPRIDHDPLTGECNGLLIEEQRTNLLTYSEQFDNAAWSKSNLSLSPNSVVAPDGALTADKLIPTAATADHFLSTGNITTTIGSSYTLSFYAKSAGHDIVLVSINGAFQYPRFNLSTGIATNDTGFVQASMASAGNGWWRCSATFVATFTAHIAFIYANTRLAAGDGYSGIYIWGAQLEAGAFPTSYIKTEASQVTRSADSASMTGTNFSSWYRQDEGTLFAEAVSPGNSDWPCVVSACRSDYSLNTIQLQFYTGGTSQAGFEVSAGGASQAGPWGSITNRAVFTKLVGAYKLNDIAYSNNGATVITDGTALIPSVELLRIGNSYNNTKPLNGHIKRIVYYPKRLSNTQLQALTT